MKPAPLSRATIRTTSRRFRSGISRLFVANHRPRTQGGHRLRGLGRGREGRGDPAADRRLRPARLPGLADRARRATRRRRTIISGASGSACRRPAKSRSSTAAGTAASSSSGSRASRREAEWRRAYDEINELEAQLGHDGAVIIKLFFHVTQEDQDERLEGPARPSLEALEGRPPRIFATAPAARTISPRSTTCSTRPTRAGRPGR